MGTKPVRVKRYDIRGEPFVMTYAEIGKRLGISEKCAEKTGNKALRKIRKECSLRGFSNASLAPVNEGFGKVRISVKSVIRGPVASQKFWTKLVTENGD